MIGKDRDIRDDFWRGWRFRLFKTRLWNGRERSRVDDMYGIQGCSLIRDLSQKSIEPILFC